MASESERLIPKKSDTGFSKRATRALRLTLGVLGLWESDAIKKAAEFHSLKKSGWDEENNDMSLLTSEAEAEQNFQGNPDGDLHAIDTSFCLTNQTVNSSNRPKPLTGIFSPS